MYRETHSRSVAKAFSWRVLGTIATAGLVFLFTRKWSLSLTVGGVEFISKIGLYWLHERIWDRVPHGKRGADRGGPVGSAGGDRDGVVEAPQQESSTTS